MQRYPIIALCGPKGCGKSTAAEALCPPRVRLSFAAPIRDALVTIGVPRNALIDPILKEQPLPQFGGKTPRMLMQTLGTDWGRNLVSESIWADIFTCRVKSCLAGGYPVVVDDLRFVNEAQLLRSLGAHIVAIRRAGLVSVDAHASEHGLSHQLIDEYVENIELSQFVTYIRRYNNNI